jgi:sugar lactone lactonase YvrE
MLLFVLLLLVFANVAASPCGIETSSAETRVPLLNLAALRIVNIYGNIVINPVPDYFSDEFTISAVHYGTESEIEVSSSTVAGIFVFTATGPNCTLIPGKSCAPERSCPECDNTTCTPCPNAEKSTSLSGASQHGASAALIVVLMGTVHMMSSSLHRGIWQPILAACLVLVLLACVSTAQEQESGGSVCGCRAMDVFIDVPANAVLRQRTYHFDTHEVEIQLQNKTKSVKLVNGMGAYGTTLTEGPTYDPTDDTLYFTDVFSSRILRIAQVSTAQASYGTFTSDSVHANGLKFYQKPDGIRWLFAARFDKIDGGIVRYNLDNATASVQILASTDVSGAHLGRPNDLSFDSQGRFYFSDRASGNDGYVKNGGIFRLDPPADFDSADAWTIKKIVDDINGDPAQGADRANGVCVAPDDKTLYVLETNSTFGQDLIAYDLDASGDVSNKRVVYDFTVGGLKRAGDGMAIDQQGNIYVNVLLLPFPSVATFVRGTYAGVHVISPTGELLDVVPLSEGMTTNVGFGGTNLMTLYANSGHKVFQWENDIKGTMR